MDATDRTIIEWNNYRPSPDMQGTIDFINQHSLQELVAAMPASHVYTNGHVRFSYRIYSDCALDEVEKVYIILGGFAERADSPDAGIKALLIDLLAKRVDPKKYAILAVGGLFSFSVSERKKLIKQGSGALVVAAEEVATLLKAKFPALQTVSVGGYSMGGVMAPLTAQAIVQRQIATVDQVCCGEPAYYPSSTTALHLLKRFARSSSYRNEQIQRSLILSYIAIKKTPHSPLARASYRVRIYQPLFWRLASMRFVIRDLALQAADYDLASYGVQIKEALRYLAKKKVRINLLHAENSVICQSQAFYLLVDDLRAIAGIDLRLTVIKGLQADHGIEEQRSLSTPFLVMPELYRSIG